jgi:hypothetical protein
MGGLGSGFRGMVLGLLCEGVVFVLDDDEL